MSAAAAVAAVASSSAAQQFSLRWNNYNSHIVSALEDLRSSDEFTDVTLSCEGKRIKAHKILLSACSTYFRDTFKENPCKHPIVIIKGVTFDDLKSIVTFMYKGQVNITQERLTSFLQTAELLQIKGLTDRNDKESGQKKGTQSSSNSGSGNNSDNSDKVQRPPSPKRKRMTGMPNGSQILDNSSVNKPTVSSAAGTSSSSTSTPTTKSFVNPQSVIIPGNSASSSATSTSTSAQSSEVPGIQKDSASDPDPGYMPIPAGVLKFEAEDADDMLDDDDFEKNQLSPEDGLGLDDSMDALGGGTSVSYMAEAKINEGQGDMETSHGIMFGMSESEGQGQREGEEGQGQIQPTFALTNRGYPRLICDSKVYSFHRQASGVEYWSMYDEEEEEVVNLEREEDDEGEDSEDSWLVHPLDPKNFQLPKNLFIQQNASSSNIIYKNNKNLSPPTPPRSQNQSQINKNNLQGLSPPIPKSATVTISAARRPISIQSQNAQNGQNQMRNISAMPFSNGSINTLAGVKINPGLIISKNKRLSQTQNDEAEIDDDEEQNEIETGEIDAGENENSNSSGVNKNQCDVCFKVFTLKTNLTAHRRRHMGDTNCPLCGKVLSTVGNLRSHILYVHKGFPHPPRRPYVSTGIYSKKTSRHQALQFVDTEMSNINTDDDVILQNYQAPAPSSSSSINSQQQRIQRLQKASSSTSTTNDFLIIG